MGEPWCFRHDVVARPQRTARPPSSAPPAAAASYVHALKESPARHNQRGSGGPARCHHKPAGHAPAAPSPPSASAGAAAAHSPERPQWSRVSRCPLPSAAAAVVAEAPRGGGGPAQASARLGDAPGGGERRGLGGGRQDGEGRPGRRGTPLLLHGGQDEAGDPPADDAQRYCGLARPRS